MEERAEHVCIICEEKKREGIFIVSEFICDACESEMVHTDAQDAKYPFFIHQMKQIWVQKNA
ncbi:MULTISPECIES: sigma factor G inhibitor Gin [Paenibacillus]|uniref:sigma factor G inhibitor Gin n=1 Tax=Paenibacillus TaxID=44249 RepID=UPI001F2BAF93|nr:sigma factor G inhibitor Gin [Paenibacillus sp. JJ-223]CAH1226958.1 Anti-sigma-G factor Gin [Paenibacillus sp. JJ-223]